MNLCILEFKFKFKLSRHYACWYAVRIHNDIFVVGVKLVVSVLIIYFRLLTNISLLFYSFYKNLLKFMYFRCRPRPISFLHFQQNVPITFPRLVLLYFMVRGGDANF